MAARLLLIEDDASISRFVELALEELPGHDPAAPAVELHAVANLAQARAALAAGGWSLVISDLMLPDGSAEVLLTDGLALADGAPPWVVFSAGVHEDRHLALAARGVARTLCKPVPLAELLGTVAELLRLAPPAAPAVKGAGPVHTHFGGDQALYDSFRAGCITRFADDLAQGDAALASADAATLRRVAHGLKAVLEMLGEPGLSAHAGALEAALEHGRPGDQTLAGRWAALADGLAGLGVQRRGGFGESGPDT
ncbi:response regulator [Roseateles sp. LYH14W]|uniref:Response regulator n=1 Tax=Pelomonas parva TaxID=3299032 RepID=A0ABW7F2M9_9BURK